MQNVLNKNAFLEYRALDIEMTPRFSAFPYFKINFDFCSKFRF